MAKSEDKTWILEEKSIPTKIEETAPTTSPPGKKARRKSGTTSRNKAAPPTNEPSPPNRRDVPVDAFILFNEQEKAVPPLVDELESRAISTHFWRRDVAPGQPWEEFEDDRLKAARAVVVFLGSLGWGPNHLRLAIEAQNFQKRIIPVLVGNPPSAAFREAGGMFERLRYVDLRDGTPASLTTLVRRFGQESERVNLRA